ncbi:MAG: hypothetical protein ACLQU1_24485 [Bryobacteraceae bacterium]
MLKRAGLGFRAHSGWAALVALGGSPATPSVLRRGRIELCTRGVHREGQPYHAAAEMKPEDAQAFLDECARTASSMAHSALQETVADLSATGYRIAGACVLMGSGRPLPGLAKVLAAHPLIHTAEGEFFRAATRQGCESCGLAVSGVKERDLAARAAGTLGISGEELERRIAALGKRIGPPWRQDEKLCATAAWILLAG